MQKGSSRAWSLGPESGSSPALGALTRRVCSCGLFFAQTRLAGSHPCETPPQAPLPLGLRPPGVAWKPASVLEKQPSSSKFSEAGVLFQLLRLIRCSASCRSQPVILSLSPCFLSFPLSFGSDFFPPSMILLSCALYRKTEVGPGKL